LGENALYDSPLPLNTPSQDDSRESGDIADESDEFCHFMVWNDLSEKEEEQKQSLTDDD
jgi:hypothetical protein